MLYLIYLVSKLIKLDSILGHRYVDGILIFTYV
jgi:hypothetical protein